MTVDFLWLALPLALLPFIWQRRAKPDWNMLGVTAVLAVACLGLLAYSGKVQPYQWLLYLGYFAQAVIFYLFFEVRPLARSIALKAVLGLALVLVTWQVLNLAAHGWNPLLANTSWCPAPMHIYEVDTPQKVVCR